MNSRPWHSLSIDEIVKTLKTNVEKGLDEREVAERLNKYGYNVIEEVKKKSLIQIFLSQFKSFLVMILLVATAISLILGEFKDAIVIFIIVFLMAILGFIQEYRAEKTVEALKKLTAPKAKVIRRGIVKIIEAQNIVPGDIVVLEEGDRIPSDLRLLETFNLYVDESSFTGESVPVSKNADLILSEKTPIHDRKNMVFMGTFVVRGKGKGVTVATGMNTELGRIAKAVQEAPKEKTPLQKNLDDLGRKLGLIFVLVSAVVFALGYLKGLGSIFELLITSVALAVAVIPEGLPAIVTIILALGVWKMARRNAIVKRLAQVETLGAATVICSDKTGTITKNEMTVKKVVLPSFLTIDVTGVGYDIKGNLKIGNNNVEIKELPKEFHLLLETMILCNNAQLRKLRGKTEVIGDPLEISLLILAEKAGVDTNKTKMLRERVHEIPFDSIRKMMSTINKSSDGKLILCSKGAPEVILSKSKYALINGKPVELTSELRNRLLKEVDEYASQALRVLAAAYRELSSYEIKNLSKIREEDLEKELVFLGFVGIIDPPREEVYEAISKAKRAGIKVVMVTGDHKSTALAIAKEIGLDVENKLVITGKELDEMMDEELEKIINDVIVFARVSPSHKVRVVKALKKKGHIVAMTGDGVNDAPALKMADIGVAMGKRGTDVAREAADLILLDDNFSTIVKAIEEGRVIYDNVKKPIRYLLSANMGEVSTILLGEILGLPLILRPTQILWINLITDSFPALALGVEPPEPNIMDRPPRKPHEKILVRKTLFYIITIGIVMAILGLMLYLRFLSVDLAYARTIVFTFLVASQLFYALSARSPNSLLYRIGLLTNKNMIYAFLIGVLLQLAATYLFPDAFGSKPLTLIDFTLAFAIATSILLFDEIRKAVKVKIP